jgi:lysophospholipase L1-like esterase
LQTTWSDIPGERGFLFPFDLAKSNNPGNYEFSSTNKWKSYRSVGKEFCELNYGLLGAIVTCSDTVIDLHFRYDRTDVKPGFTRIRIFHNKGDFPYNFNFGEFQTCISERRDNPDIGYTDIFFAHSMDSFDLKMTRTSNKPFEVQISGIQLTNEEPGVSYTAIGVNGAALYTYLECGNFEEQLKQSAPDFFAFSVGTNDANVPYDKFDPLIYKANLEKMMKMVLSANPNCAILLTVPNDSYYLKKHLNRNIERQREVIIELAIQYKCPVWDLYGLMGELGSSKIWQDALLMKEDKVHFTAAGYHLKGDLYFDAFMKWLEQMDNQKLKRK